MTTDLTYSAAALPIQEEKRASLPVAHAAGLFFAARGILTLVTVRIFGMDADVGVIAGLALNYAFLVLAATSSNAGVDVSSDALIKHRCSRCAMAFLLLSGISLTWTVAASLSSAIAFWCAMLADAAIVWFQLKSHRADAIAAALFSGFVQGAALVAVIAWILPAQSDMRLGDEELLGPNQIGWPCGLAFFFAQYLIRKKIPGAWKWYATLLCLTLFRSLSKTTIVAFIVAQTCILLADSNIARKTKFRIAALGILAGAVFSFLAWGYFDTYADSTSAESLTGRVGIWAYMLTEAVEMPWLGHGFHSVWKVIPPFYSSAFQARHAHNEIVQQCYAYGALGLAVFAAVYASIARTLREFADKATKPIFIGLLIFTLTRGLADTEAFDLSWPMWLLILFAALAVQAAPHQEATV